MPQFDLVEVPNPVLTTPTSVLIRVAAIGVCTSDLHALRGIMHVPDGNVVGHEYSGVVAGVGAGVRSIRLGDRVVGELAVGACGECEMCRSGRYEFCRAKQPPGWASPGVYSEYVVTEEWLLHIIPVNVTFEVAALSEPTAVCVYGCLERGAVAPTDYVVIYGMGSIGLLTLVALLDAGNRKVVCVSTTRHGTRRLELAEELGASLAVASEDDVISRIAEDTAGRMPDVVVDCTGAAQAINDGIHLLRRDGTFVALGIASTPTVAIDFNAAVLKPIRMVFSCTSSHSAWVRTMRILSRQYERLRRIVTDLLPLEEWAEAYERLEQREAVKAVLYNDESDIAGNGRKAR